ncbi:MAG TPA: hypothetical protein VH352_24640 [Pseudonocardiaceae bacterium]|nr:hypothetical protein [Pseudonocardiaceae bacterium]
MNGSVTGFFSYTQADDECEQHRIARLAELVRNEYSLVTGRDLTVSTRWREDPGAFFVPVITPRYLRQPECRQDLLDFAVRARDLGVAELFLPIVYTRTHELTDPSNEDAAVALIRRTQHENWYELRTDDERSPAHRRAVCRLVSRLTQASDRPPLDMASALEDAIPRWGQAFALMTDALTRMAELREKMDGDLTDDPRRGTAIGRLAILRRYADEIMKPAREILSIGGGFADEVIQLDPSVLALVRAATPPADPLADYTCSLILAGADRLRHNADVVRGYDTSMARLSEILDDPVNDVAIGVLRMLDGFALISEWDQRVRATGRH